jgi:hypothetical protein
MGETLLARNRIEARIAGPSSVACSRYAPRREPVASHRDLDRWPITLVDARLDAANERAHLDLALRHVAPMHDDRELAHARVVCAAKVVGEGVVIAPT